MKLWNVGVIYCDAPDAGSGGGNAGGNGNGAGAPAGGNAGSSAPAAAGTGTGASGAAGASAAQPNAQPAAKKYEYAEDRSTWVPGHKVRAQTEELRTLRAQIAEANRRVAALAGVQPANPGDPESNAIKEQLFKVVPELKDLIEKRERLLKAAEFDFDSVSTDQQQRWAATGHNALRLLTSELKAAYGGQELTPKASAHFQTAFIAHLAQNDELRERFESGDIEGVVKEYVTDITEGVFSPFKRLAAAPATDPRQAPARRLPRQGGGGPVGVQQRTVAPKDGDKFHSAAFDAFTRG